MIIDFLNPCVASATVNGTPAAALFAGLATMPSFLKKLGRCPQG
jgi:hypothetical protein